MRFVGSSVIVYRKCETKPEVPEFLIYKALKKPPAAREKDRLSEFAIYAPLQVVYAKNLSFAFFSVATEIKRQLRPARSFFTASPTSARFFPAYKGRRIKSPPITVTELGNRP